MKYAFYGDGRCDIDQPRQLCQALAMFRNYFNSRPIKAYVPQWEYDILDLDGLNKGIGGIEWVRNPFKLIHRRDHDFFDTKQLTVLETSKLDGKLTHIFVKGNANTFYDGDKFQMVDGVIGSHNVRVKKNDSITMCPVQFCCENYSQSEPDVVKIGLWPVRGIDDTNVPITAGMQVQFLPSHKIGYISGEHQHDRMDLIFPISEQELVLHVKE